MNKNDLRYIRTERAIKEAFIKAIDEYGYQKTTVSLLCQEAVVSRNAFYLHFATIEELLDSFYEDLKEDFGREYPDFSNIRESVRWYIEVIDKNHELACALLKCPTVNFRNLLYEYVIRIPMKLQYEDFDEQVKNVHTQLALSYALEAMISFTRCWLEHYDTLTANEAETDLFPLCKTPTERLYQCFKKPKK